MRPLLLPGLLDAARHNAAHGRPGVALFESAHVYRPRGAARRRRPPRRPAGGCPRTSATTSARCSPRRRRAAGAASAGRPTSSRRARCSRRCSRSAGVDWRAERGRRPFLHPGRAASIVAGASERKLGWIGELHPLVAREWDLPGPVAGFEIDFEALLELTARPGGRLPRRDELPRRAAGHRRGGAGGACPPPRSRRRCAPAAASCSRGVRACSTSTAASRWARGTSRWRCGSSSGRPTAR